MLSRDIEGNMLWENSLVFNFPNFICNEFEGNIDLKIVPRFRNPGKTCNSEIKLGSWKTEQKLCFIVNKKRYDTRIGVNSKRLQTPKISSPRFIFAKGVQMKPLFKKYFTTEDANLYTHWSDPFATQVGLCPLFVVRTLVWLGLASLGLKEHLTFYVWQRRRERDRERDKDEEDII